MGNEHKFNFNIWATIVYPCGGIVAYAETVLCNSRWQCGSTILIFSTKYIYGKTKFFSTVLAYSQGAIVGSLAQNKGPLKGTVSREKLFIGSCRDI